MELFTQMESRAVEYLSAMGERFLWPKSDWVSRFDESGLTGHELISDEEAMEFIFIRTQVVEKLLAMLLGEISECSPEVTEGHYLAADLLQHACSAAVWKYNLKITPALDDFMREFDRLDTSFERDRFRVQAVAILDGLKKQGMAKN